ncbi:uncharacterized protein LOC111459783 isoform X1 [Cucurbita moschata]|uniref:Uncharacterized protein LOC111459783 isoform X1 n=1 Tax=Cucurbita moschata TaxID=3662 RepID=A0A6J1H3Z6_CUCMO|nr:uncharacterized protein LOC111459783 isoform X1 [Cucurbita moschata]XP_022958619.1 uncharacterized protein LOC111459783 isoform X1 [Cucurbita moschata]
MFQRVLGVILIGLSAWAFSAIRPPAPKICGSVGGPPITGPRIKLRDGRHLAYKEHGVSRTAAKFKIIYIHGFSSCRHDAAVAIHPSPGFLEELGVYVVSLDRPGYGESDPHPTRTVESLALDVEELGDQLGLGPKFYVIGLSMGGQAVWGCLKYIPHRLAGASLLAPAINYWWPSFPANLSKEGLSSQLPQDQWALRVAHHLPWLTYWWNTQKFFPQVSILAGRPEILSSQDIEIIRSREGLPVDQKYVRQQGEFESLHRDLMVGFGKWEFDPMLLENIFPKNEGSVHLWQGDDDKLVPVKLQRYITQKLPWIHYHELSGAGHLFVFTRKMSEEIVRSLLEQ